MIKRKFATVIHCIDGRVQRPTLSWIRDSLLVDFVDSVTEPGADKVLSEGTSDAIKEIKRKVLFSTEGHKSRIIAIVGHNDCLANPGPKEMHFDHIKKATTVIKEWKLGVRVLGLWVGENWEVECIYDSEGEIS